MKPLTPEDREIVKLRRWLHSKFIEHFHIKNEKKNPGWNELREDKMRGISGGAPDYAIVIDKKHRKSGWNKLIFCEMKRGDGKGVASAKQKHWIQLLKDCEGVSAFVAHGADDAISYLSSFIQIIPPPCTEVPTEQDILNM